MTNHSNVEMGIALFTQEELHRLYLAILDTNIEPVTLLAGLEPNLRAGLERTASTNGDYLLTVLNELNRIQLVDGTLPFRTVLATAHLRAGPRIQAEVFAKALSLLTDVFADRDRAIRADERILPTPARRWLTELFSDHAPTALAQAHGEVRPTGHRFEGYWRSTWKYGVETCQDLIHLAYVDERSRLVLGRRTAITGKFSHHYNIIGQLLRDCLYLIASNVDPTTHIGVTLVLRPQDNFDDHLAGIAIRPTGAGKALPKISGALFHELGFWAGRVVYRREKKPSLHGKLWTAHTNLGNHERGAA